MGEAVRAIWSPVAAMENVARERKLGTGFGVIALAALLALAFSAISVFTGNAGTQINPQDFPTIPPETLRSMETVVKVGLPVFSVLVPFVWWIGVSLVMQLVTRFFGGNGPLSAMFAVVGVAYVPFLISGVVSFLLTSLQRLIGVPSAAASVIGIVSFLLALGFVIWHVALVIIGASFAREVSYGRSGGSCAISCVGFVVLVVVLILAAVLVVALATGALGGR